MKKPPRRTPKVMEGLLLVADVIHDKGPAILLGRKPKAKREWEAWEAVQRAVAWIYACQDFDEPPCEGDT